LFESLIIACVIIVALVVINYCYISHYARPIFRIGTKNEQIRHWKEMAKLNGERADKYTVRYNACQSESNNLLETLLRNGFTKQNIEVTPNECS
jgi:hypothetical protein